MIKYLWLFSLLSQLSWANEFRMIDGKNYYEVLGVGRSATEGEIKKAFREKMKKAHPDTGGGEQMAKDINEANDTLKDQDRRSSYDHWLDTAQSRQSRGGQQRRPKTDAEMREDIIIATVREVDKKAHEWLRQRPDSTYDQLAHNATFTILYNVRFFPMANMELSDLSAMIFNYSLDPTRANQYSEVGMVTLAGAAIKVLQERMHERYYAREAQQILRRVEDHLVRGMNGKVHYDLHAQYLNHIYTILKGVSFFDQGRRQAQVQADCQSGLTTKVRVRGPDGREYEIPITIEIKLGR